jgi:cell division septation protein DedD
VTLNVDLAAVTIPASQISDLTATAAELNILDGVTSDAAELNILDGVTATTAEINILDGVTADATELNYVDGVTSGIQSQLDDKALLTPAVNAKTAAYTLAVGDRGETITADGTFTITAPSATFSAGDRVDFVNIGTGVITFAGSGVTVNSKDAALTIDTQYSAASILFLSSSTAVLIGDIA